MHTTRTEPDVNWTVGDDDVISAASQTVPNAPSGGHADSGGGGGLSVWDRERVRTLHLPLNSAVKLTA